MSMGTYEDQTADKGDVASRRGAARDGRAAAMSRRRALAAGRSAVAPTEQRVPIASRDAGHTPVAIDGMAAGRLGRALSMQRRRQLSQGKQALGEDRSEAAASAVTPVLIVHHGGAR